jgi:hypothetical protein
MPILCMIGQEEVLNSMRYYWVTAQSEYSTDILFRKRADLEELMLRLCQYSTLYFGATDVMSFLGRKLTGHFLGEVVTDQMDVEILGKRVPGRRVKHRMKCNWIKMYDRGTVLRVETVIGREACLELTLKSGLVENARRIASLLAIVLRWKTAEVALDGEVLGRQQLTTFLAKLERVRQCWLRRKGQGAEACQRSCRLGCPALRIEPSQDLGYISSSAQPWFTVGRFDGERVLVDKQALREQVAADRHAAVRLCPFFDAHAVAAAIDGLPDTLAADDSTWTKVYDLDGKPAWLWPHGQPPPMNLSTTIEGVSPVSPDSK